MPDDPFNGPSYDLFVKEMAKHCRCCHGCCSPPCDGVLAGGMCDEVRCRCDDDSSETYDDE